MLKIKNSVLKRFLSVGMVCLFLINDLAFALAPPSRFKPLISIEKRGNLYVIIENTDEIANLKDGFPEDVGFLYLSELIGQALRLGLSPRGLKTLIKRDLPDIDFTRFRWRDLREEEGAFCLPYVRKDDGRTHVLKFHASGEVTAEDLSKVSIPIEGAPTILDALRGVIPGPPAGSPHAVFKYMLEAQGARKKPVTFMKKEIAKALNRAESTIQQDINTLLAIGLIDRRRAQDKGRGRHYEYFLTVQRWISNKEKRNRLSKVPGILASYGAKVPLSRRKELKAKIDKLLGVFYTDFEEALEAFKAEYMSWKTKTNLDVQRKFVEALAKELGKKPGLLCTVDFDQFLNVFEDKSLAGLLISYGYPPAKALKKLKKELGIEDLLPTGIYRNYEEVLAHLRKGIKIKWGAVSPEIQFEFVEALAKALKKKAGELIPADFEKSVHVFGGNNLTRLCGHYMCRRGQRRTTTKAIKDLKKELGIRNLADAVIPYGSYKEALAAFKKNEIKWKRTPPEVKLKFVEALAKALKKKAGELIPADFRKPVACFASKRRKHGKPLRSLLEHYLCSAKSPKPYANALKELKKEVGIEDLTSGNKEWKEKICDWQVVCGIIEEHMDFCVNRNTVELFLRTHKLTNETQFAFGREIRERGNSAARDALAIAHLYILTFYVRKYSARNPDIGEDEFRQAGERALYKCAENFDPDRGVSFSTYVGSHDRNGKHAIGAIEGAMLDLIRKLKGTGTKKRPEKPYSVIVPQEDIDLDHPGYMADIVKEDVSRPWLYQGRALTEEEEGSVRAVLSGRMHSRNLRRDIDIFILCLKGEERRKIAERFGLDERRIVQIVTRCKRVLEQHKQELTPPAGKGRDFARLSALGMRMTFKELFGPDPWSDEARRRMWYERRITPLKIYTHEQLDRLREFLEKFNVPASRRIVDVFQNKNIRAYVRWKMHEILIDEFIESFYAKAGGNRGRLHHYGDADGEYEEIAKIKKFFCEVLGFSGPWEIFEERLQTGYVNVLHVGRKDTIFDAHASPMYGLNICDSAAEKDVAIVHEIMALYGFRDDEFNEKVAVAYKRWKKDGHAPTLQSIKRYIRKDRKRAIEEFSRNGYVADITDIGVMGKDVVEVQALTGMNDFEQIEQAISAIRGRGTGSGERVSEAYAVIEEALPSIVATYASASGDLVMEAEYILERIFNKCPDILLDDIFIQFQLQNVQITDSLRNAFRLAYLSRWSSNPRKTVGILIDESGGKEESVELMLKRVAILGTRALYFDSLVAKLPKAKELADIAYRRAYLLLQDYLRKYAKKYRSRIEKEGFLTLNPFDTKKKEIEATIEAMLIVIINNKKRFAPLGIKLGKAERKYAEYCVKRKEYRDAERGRREFLESEDLTAYERTVNEKLRRIELGIVKRKRDCDELIRNFSKELLYLSIEDRDFAKLRGGEPNAGDLSDNGNPYKEEKHINGGFDALDRAYNGNITKEIERKLAQKPNEPVRILMLGVGRGFEAFTLMQKYGDRIKITALAKEDLLYKVAEDLKKRFEEEGISVTPKEADIYIERLKSGFVVCDLNKKLPIRDTYDLVIFGTHVCRHIERKIFALEEALGACEEGGNVYCDLERAFILDRAQWIRAVKYFAGLKNPNIATFDNCGIKFTKGPGLTLPRFNKLKVGKYSVWRLGIYELNVFYQILPPRPKKDQLYWVMPMDHASEALASPAAEEALLAREKNIATDFVDELIMRAEKARAAGEQIILGLDTSWISDMKGRHGTIITPLLREIERLPGLLERKGLDNVLFVRGEGDEVARDIKDQKNPKTPFSNIIVLGGVKAVKSDEFKNLKSEKPDDRALLVGVNTACLGNNGVRLVEMYLLAMAIGNGKTPSELDTEFIIIEKDPDADGTFIFTPVKPFSLDAAEEIYELQTSEIHRRA